MQSKIKFTHSHAYMDYPYKKLTIRNNKIIHSTMYISKKEDTDYKHSLTYDEWKNIVFTFLDELFKYLITGKLFIVPHGFGVMRLKKRKLKSIDRKYIDYAKTKELYGEYNNTVEKEERKYIYHTNKHTQDYIVRFYWHKNLNSLPISRFFKFRLNRTAKSRLAKYLKSNIDAVNYISE